MANKFDNEAIKILKKKKNIRLIDASNFVLNKNYKIYSSNNAILLQNEDKLKFSHKDFRIFSKIKFSN